MARLVESLRAGNVTSAELRPPRAELATAASMDAWIDTYHAVKNLTRDNTFVFLTDSAVGTKEEDNLRHLVSNLGRDVPRSSIAPFLTTKHPLEWCLSYADRALSAWIRIARRAWRRQERRPAALRRACVAAARAHQRAPAGSGAWGMGESSCRCGDAGALPDVGPRDGGVLSDPDRVASQPAAGRALPGRSRSAGRRASGSVRRVLLPFGECANAADVEGLPARYRSTSSLESSAAARRPKRSAPDRSASCAPPACVTSMSATCRSAARRRPCDRVMALALASPAT